jgi:hypothetical protein
MQVSLQVYPAQRTWPKFFKAAYDERTLFSTFLLTALRELKLSTCSGPTSALNCNRACDREARAELLPQALLEERGVPIPVQLIERLKGDTPAATVPISCFPRRKGISVLDRCKAVAKRAGSILPNSI